MKAKFLYKAHIIALWVLALSKPEQYGALPNMQLKQPSKSGLETCFQNRMMQEETRRWVGSKGFWGRWENLILEGNFKGLKSTFKA